MVPRITSYNVCYTKLLRAGGRHGGQCAAVEAVVEGDDLPGAVAPGGAPFPRQLDGAFVGLGAAVGEEHLIESAQGGQALGQLQGGRVVESGTRVDQRLALRAERGADRRMAVAEGVDGPALDEVEPGVALLIVV